MDLTIFVTLMVLDVYVSEAGRFVRFLNLHLIGISLDDFLKVIFRAKMHAIEQKVLFNSLYNCDCLSMRIK